MIQNHLTRRRFLTQTSSVAAVISASSLAAHAQSGSNDRINVGIIGCGGRGTDLMNQILKHAEKMNIRVIAVCDVWKVNLNRAVKNVTEKSGQKPQAFTRFGDLLALDEIDAVVIATPDFGHTPIMIEALKANKDVYVEKPMAMEIEHANTALRLARENSRIVQVGTQRRSESHFLSAAKTIRTGVLGNVTCVSAAVAVNHPRWLRDFSDCKEQDVDWDAYLFNREKVPFDPRLLRRWHLHKMCTLGLSGLWMCHFADAVNILMNSSYPSSAVAHGGTYQWKDEREICDTYHSLIEYPEKFLFSWQMTLANGTNNHCRVFGRNATLDVDKLTFLPCGGPKDKEIGDMKIERVPGQDHMGNWIDCMRTRKLPNADIEYGRQHTVAIIMAAKALNTGLRHIYQSSESAIKPGMYPMG